MLESLISQSSSFDTQKADYGSDHAMKWIAGHGLVMEKNGVAVPYSHLTKHAWQQFAERMGPVSWTGAKGSLPYELVSQWVHEYPEPMAEILNRHVERYQSRNRNLFIRGYQGCVRAVLTDSYVDTPNTQLLETIDRSLEQMIQQGAVQPEKVKLVRPSITADSIHVQVVLNHTNTNEGEYGIGFSVRNDETGRSALYCGGLIQRHACTNSIVMDTTNALRVTHRGDVQYLMNLFTRAIIHAFRISLNSLENLMRTQEIEIPNLDQLVTSLAKKNQWNDAVQKNVLMGTENKQTMFGLINGITYAAHASVSNPDDRFEMEKLAGKILIEPGSLFDKAEWVKQYALIANSNN